MPLGGKRKGAGRPFGSGIFKGPTKPIRVPARMIPLIYQQIAFQLAHEDANKFQPEAEKVPFPVWFNHIASVYYKRLTAGKKW